MNSYEMGLVVKPNLSETDVNSLVERLKTMIGEQGGTVEAVDLWGKRRLAYPVEKHTEGYYVFIRFLLSPSRVEEINRVVGITEEILRHIVVKECQKSQTAARETVQEELVEAPSDNVTGDVQAQSE